MKSGKFRIIASVCCLVAAIALAAFTVFAWFTTVNTAKTNGIETQTTSGDVVTFSVLAYQASSTDGTDYTLLDEEVDTDMKDYTPRTADFSGSDTAMILAINIKFNENHSQNTYNLSAQLNHTNTYPAPETFESFTDENYLSNAITFRSVVPKGNEANTYTLSTEDTNIYSFVKDVTINDKSVVFLKENNIANIEYEENAQTVYFVMDYNADYISALYTYMIGKYTEATINTEIKFKHDIIFKLG